MGRGFLIGQNWQNCCQQIHISIFQFNFFKNYSLENLFQCLNWRCYTLIYSQTIPILNNVQYVLYIGFLIGRKMREVPIESWNSVYFKTYICLNLPGWFPPTRYLPWFFVNCGFFVETIFCMFNQVVWRPIEEKYRNATAHLVPIFSEIEKSTIRLHSQNKEKEKDLQKCDVVFFKFHYFKSLLFSITFFLVSWYIYLRGHVFAGRSSRCYKCNVFFSFQIRSRSWCNEDFRKKT